MEEALRRIEDNFTSKFIKYEIEYDALATFRQIKEDISKGNWFLK